MSLAAVLEEAGEAWTMVDGNILPDPAAEIIARLSASPRSGVSLLAVTVIPGPQLTQAVRVCRLVREALPHVPIVLGGYFPTQHADTVLRAPYVDFVIRSQGEDALLQLVKVLRTRGLLNSVSGLSWCSAKASAERDAQIVNNPIQPLTDLDELPELPYHRVDITATSTRTTSASGRSRTTRRSGVRSPAASARWWRCR